MIVFSDLHLKDDNAETVFNDVLKGLVVAASVENDKTLVCLGDFWHLRYQVSVHLQNRVMETLLWLGKLGISVHLLPGNHDQINVQGENALEIFSILPHVSVYSEPTWNKYGLWIPYRKNKEDVLAAVSLPNEHGYPRVIWMHNGVKGAMLKMGVTDTKGIEPREFDDWIVYCGHYHLRQTVGNVQYIGSPYQTRVDDTGLKGYAVIDETTFQARFVDVKWGKQYYNVNVDDLFTLDTQPGDEVRVRMPQGVDAEAVIKQLAEVGVRCIPVMQVEVQEQRLNVGEDSSFTAYIEAYVKEFGGKLDKNKLLAMYQGYARFV